MSSRIRYGMCRRFVLCVAPLLLLAACSGERQVFKTPDIERGLSIVDAGLSPDNPEPLSRGTAWAEIRDAASAQVYIAHIPEAEAAESDFVPGADRFEALSLSPAGETDAFFQRRYEAEMAPRPSDTVLYFYFEAIDEAGEDASSPPAGREAALAVPAQAFVLDFPWPSWPSRFTPTECAFDRSLFDSDFAAPGGFFIEMDDPIFLPPNQAVILGNRAGVLDGVGLEIDGKAFFYPLAILLWQEVANSDIEDLIPGGTGNLVMSYCPLTDTAVAFRHSYTTTKQRKWDQGGLYNSNLVVSDPRPPLTKVPQMLSFGLDGVLDGECIEVVPTTLTSWPFWVKLHPDTVVLNGDEKMPADVVEAWNLRDNPYRIYWKDHDEIRFPIKTADTTHPLGLRNKDRVLGVVGEGQPLVFPLRIDGERKSFVLNEDSGTRPIVALHLAGPGYTAVFDRLLPDTGELLNFEWANASLDGVRLLRDDREETGLWTVTGVAVSGPLAGMRLSWVPSMRAFWFAWNTMYPHSTMIHPLREGDQ